jgi:hypothetical protein
MSWHTVSLADVVPSAWKNGGGVTRELLAWPSPADWVFRLSVAEVTQGGIAAPVVYVGADIADVRGLVAARYDGMPGTTYLIRPDQYVAARWRHFDKAAIQAAIARAIAV